MNDATQISELLHELEESIPEVVYQQVAEDQWLLAWDDHSIIRLDLESAHRRLTLTTGVGQPEPEQEVPIHKSLLMYNTLWSETGGVMMGLLDDEVVQFCSVCSCELTPVAFRSIVQGFVSKALIWEIWIAVGEVETPPPDVVQPDPSPEALFV